MELQVFSSSASLNSDFSMSNGNCNGNGNQKSPGTECSVSQLERSISLRSYNEWSPSQQGVTLAWQDVSVYAVRSNKKKFKRIINSVTGGLTSGTLVALMGSSGAGKSTLMSALAYRSANNTTVQGNILVNGCPVGPFMYRLSGFVHQEDLFFGSLTVREHMTCMAHLKLDRRISRKEIRKRIDEILDETGLHKCADTRIGEEGEGKMLSGGEKKRLAFATELLTHPSILFCDEPTTGLDSHNAQKLISTLQRLVRSQNTAIMCTIHQPSSQLFAMFDQVLLLAEGRTAFFGQPKEAIAFFEELGYVCPENYNPADYLIGVLATEGGHERASMRVAQRICDNFAVSMQSQQRELLVNLEMHMYESGNYKVKDELQNFKKPFWWVTVFYLVKRFLMNVVRDPTVQLLRILQKVAIAIMAGLCFSGAVDSLKQTGVQAIQGALFIFVSENTFTPMYSVLSVFPQTFPIMLRETKSGLYSTDQYYISNMLAMLPGLIVEPTLFAIIAYFLASLRPTFYAFFFTVLASVLVMNVSTSCGCFFSAAFNSVPFAMAYLVPFDYILMITAGNFIRLKSMAPVLSYLAYLSWLMYGNEIMSIVQFQGVENITCIEEEPELPCFRSGEEVLANFNFSEDHLFRDIFAMVIMYFGFHILGYLFLLRRTKRS